MSRCLAATRQRDVAQLNRNSPDRARGGRRLTGRPIVGSMATNERYPEGPGIYHVTTRSVRRLKLYRDFHDYEHFERFLGWVAGDEEWLLIAYVVMPNHYHLVVETTRPNLSQG